MEKKINIKKIISYLMVGVFIIGFLNFTFLKNNMFVQKAYADTIDYTQVKTMCSNLENNKFYFLYNDGSVKVANIGCNQGNGVSTSIQELFPVGSVSKIYYSYNTFTIYFLMTDGTVKGLGMSTNGQLGNTNLKNPTPVTVPVSNVKDIYTNGYTTYFLLNDNTVKGLGMSIFGQLGNTNNTNSNLVNVPITNVKKIYINGFTTYFLLNDGSIKGLGDSTYGQLGNTNTTNNAPVTIALANVKDIYVYMYENPMLRYTHTLFLLNDGTVKGLGYSGYGELGNTNATNSTFVTLPISNVSNIYPSYTRDYYLLNDGTLKGLGNSDYGQLGNTNSINNTPVNIPISNVTGIFNYGFSAVSVLFYTSDNNIFMLGQNNAVVGANPNTKYTTPFKLDTSKYKNILYGYYENNLYYMADDGIYVLGINLVNEDYDTSVTNIYATPTNETTPIKLDTLFSLTDQFTKTINNRTTDNFNNYNNLVNTLPDGQTKQYWEIAIDTPYAEFTGNTGDWQTATNLLTIMNTSSKLYANYSARLTALKPKLESYAEPYVQQAELSKSKTDIDMAYKYVIPLPTDVSPNKQSMLLRLDTVATNNTISSQNAIINANINENEIMNLLNNTFDLLTKTISATSLQMIKDNLDITKQKIDALDDSNANKTILNNEYQSLLSNYNVAVISYNDLLLTNATNAVNIAKQTMKQSDIDYANAQINKLSDGVDKTNLQNQITILINDINTLITNSTNAVITAETSKTQADVDSARTLIYSLPDSTTKTDLQTRLNIVQDEIINTMTGQQLIDTATNYVGKAETDKTQLSIDMARIFVDKLPDSTTKTDLQNRLDVVQQVVDNVANEKIIQEQQALQTLIDNATNSVQQAEMTQSLIDVQSARTLVNLLPEGITKTDLENRLNAIVVNGTLTSQNVSNEIDVNLVSDSALEISMPTNMITFGSYNPLTDIEKQSVINVNILSNLPYNLSVTGLDDFKNTNGNTITINHLQMKVHDDTDYKTLIKNTPVIIAENQPPTVSKDYSIDMKMLSDASANVGIYKSIIKIAVQQQ